MPANKHKRQSGHRAVEAAVRRIELSVDALAGCLVADKKLKELNSKERKL